MIQTAQQLAIACKEVAEKNKTLYVLGSFGWPMTKNNQERALKAYSFNAESGRAEKIRNATEETFGFDCVCFIKALLWGWNGDSKAESGGAVYKSNGVPDINEAQMLQNCQEVSGDFSDIAVGEFLWIPGHAGIYLGDGWAAECTHRWDDGVQLTEVENLRKPTTPKHRMWHKHGKLPYVRYENVNSSSEILLSTLRQGNRGDAVKALQILLMGYGFDCGNSGADGIFGSKTLTAVTAFQKSRQLGADGIVGKQTWSRLLGVNAFE